MKKLSLILFLCALFSAQSTFSQIHLDDVTHDESILYAQTKQVNQFFRRFNNEEDTKGIRYDSTDAEYRTRPQRLLYLKNLFDKKNQAITSALKEKFIAEVASQQKPQYLSFRQPGWFAEVKTKFRHNGTKKDLWLFLKLEKLRKGYKWGFSQVFFPPFTNLFFNDPEGETKFMHPMSHEIDFMNFNKVFKDYKNLEYYSRNNYQPDYLSLFFYEVKRSNLIFEHIESVKFHFFQIDGWYFQLSYFNRQEYNSGWLISNVVELPTEEDKERMQDFIFRR